MHEVPERLSTSLADRYRIEGRLGEGGMATVYLAEDLKHDRKVALKVLRPDLAAVVGADRFLQEIKTTAQLQHPHILPLYDSGHTLAANGRNAEFLYYVMPYIQGETLRDKLERDVQLGIEEAVKITTEIADALQYAHERGVIHRDIKPENILLHNGRAMVADFGIALAVSAAGGGRMTETGLSLGTPHYMSPEQATAEKQITNRSDVYSLGAMLYEMLTGELPHTGATAHALILKIVSDEVRPVRQLRKAVPPHVEAAIAKAVEKLPADRFDSAKAFAEALRNPAFAAAAAPVAVTPRRFVVPALSALVVLTAAVAAWGWLRPSPARVVTRFPTTLDADGALDGITLRVETALSPDGASLVFRRPLKGPGQLYLKRRDELTARPLAGTEGGSGPFFSPDGAWIGFVANGELRKVPSAGGTSLKLVASVDPSFNQPAWLTDGSIVYYDYASHTLRRVRAGETQWQVIASPEKLDGRYPWLPTPLPDARGILFTAHLTNCVGAVSCRPSRVYAYDARRDTIRTLFDDAVGAWYVSTGHVLYLSSSGTLMAVRWDNDALEATGKPVPILDGIQAPGFVVSDEGTAVYLLGTPEFAPGPKPNASFVWVDRSGRVEPVDSSWQVNTGGRYRDDDLPVDWGFALSPDGRRLAFTQLTEFGTDIWIKQLPTGPVSRLTLHPGDDRSPAWMADGRSVTFISDRPLPAGGAVATNTFGRWQQPADGTGDARPLASDSTGSRIVARGYNEESAALSPDARWVAYLSNEPGENEVFVRPFPDVNGGRWQISSGGGSAPIWAHNGRELFFAKGTDMYVVRIDPGPPFAADAPRRLFSVSPYVRAGLPFKGTLAISPDDQRFLMVRDNSWEAMAGTPRMVVVQNFFEELRAKLKQ